VDRHKHGAQPRTRSEGRAPADGLPARPPQDHDVGRGPAHDRDDRTNGARRPINGEWFEAYVGQVLVPELRHGDIVIMDNLSSHKRASVRELIEAAGASLLFLPPYRPDFNPIEKAFARLKAMLRKAAERTVSGFGTSSASLSTSSNPPNAPTTSGRAATIQTDQNPL